MLKKTLLAAAAGATALGLAVPALAWGSGGWHASALPGLSGQGAYAEAVTSAGQGDAWVFGQNSAGAQVALHRTGSAWKLTKLPGAGANVTVARATAASDVWAFVTVGTGSEAMHYHSGSWSVAGKFASTVDDAIAYNPGNIWAFSTSAWHYNGSTWSKVAGGSGLTSGSAVSATSIWAGGGSVVAHWNGTSWTRTSVARLLPRRIAGGLNDPAIVAMSAQSADSVYAIADGNAQDQGGPIYILHWNGSTWSKVASAGGGYTSPDQVIADGSGGLWLATQAAGANSAVLHYSGGRVTRAALPDSGTVHGLSLIPGTGNVLASMAAHSAQLLLAYQP